MFTIKPAAPEDYYDIKEICEKHGKPLELSAEKYIMVAKENGFSGIGIFEIKDGIAEFTDIFMVDEENSQMKYFIAKAVLNSIDLKGIADVYSNSEYLEPVFKMCRFEKESDGTFHLNLEGYFTGCGSCGKN